MASLPLPAAWSPAVSTRSRPAVGAARYRAAPRRGGPRWISGTAIVAAHVAIVVGLLQIDAVRDQVAEAAPLFVRFITPAAPLPVAAVPPPPRPTPEPPKPRVIASAKATPTPLKAPAPVVEAPPVATPAAVAPPAEPVASAPAAALPAAPLPVQPPRFTGAGLDNPQADYPLMSRRLKETGRVQLKVLVDVDGRPERVELDRSSGFSRLDAAALDAVRRWHFVPAKQGERTVAQWVNVAIPFELTHS